MGSGLSMASVNKIKELANAREYSLALDIIDSQDLSKSLNPQFLRLCGEVYMYNRRYADARRVLLIAHRLAPEAKRVIYSLIYLYLKMGYWELAKIYYEIYMFDADETVLETKQLMYIYGKAQKHSIDNLEPYIAPAYSHTMDYDWTYETFLLYMLQGKRKEAESLAQIYGATFKKSENSLTMESLLEGSGDLKELFDVFASGEVADDEPGQEAERELEQKLLEADELRIHPKEPEITIMVDDDDDDEIEIGSKRKLKKFLKEQERLEREGNTGAEADFESSEDVSSPEGDESEMVPEDKKGKGLFKGIFQKKKKGQSEAVESSDTETDKGSETTEEPAGEKSVSGEKKPLEDVQNSSDGRIAADGKKAPEEAEKPADEKKGPEEAEKSADEKKGPEQMEKSADALARREEYEKARAVFFGGEGEPHTGLADDKKQADSIGIRIEEADIMTQEAEEMSENTDPEIKQSPVSERLDMREMHVKEHNSKRNSIVSIDFDEEDFAAESETVEDLRDSFDFDNPPDDVYEPPQETHEPALKSKKSITFEEADMVDEDEEVFEADDFSTPHDDEFGEMHAFTYEDAADVSEEAMKVENGDAGEASAEEAFTEETIEKITEEVEEDTVFEAEEADTEVEEEFTETEEADTEVEEEFTETKETDTKVEEEVKAGADMDAGDKTDTDNQAVSEETDENTEFPSQDEPENLAELFKQTPKKKALDYPVFRSSLFPDYHKDVVEVTNNFDDIMHEANDKIQENLLKEEQMQREAEALLASLGIDMESISVTAEDYDSVSEALYDGPSRDELKTSLKIDSVKKDILKKLKEYR